jgi:hypothetical protein
MAAEFRLSYSNKLVHFYIGRIMCNVAGIDNREFPGNKGCDCQPSEKFENGMSNNWEKYNWEIG